MSACKNCKKEIPLDSVQVGGVHMYCEQEYFHDKTEIMIKVRPEHCSWAVFSVEEAKQIIDEIADPENQERGTYEFKTEFYTKHEIEVMPDFEGW